MTTMICCSGSIADLSKQIAVDGWWSISCRVYWVVGMDVVKFQLLVREGDKT